MMVSEGKLFAVGCRPGIVRRVQVFQVFQLLPARKMN